MNVSPSEPTLQSLLIAAKRERGASGRRLAELAQKHGFRAAGTTLNAIIAGTYKSTPSDDTVRAIAWLAGVTEGEAFAAAGLRVPGPPLSDELPPGVDLLQPKARKAVVELLRVLVEQEEGGERERRSASTRQSRGSRDPKNIARERRLLRDVVGQRIADSEAELRVLALTSLAEDKFAAALAQYVDDELKRAFVQVDEIRRPIEMDADYLASLEHQSVTALPRDEADEVVQARRRIEAMSELDVMLAARDDDDDDEAQAQQDEP